MGKIFNTLVLSGIAAITLVLLDGSSAFGVIGQLFISPPTNWGSFIIDALTESLVGLTVFGGAVAVIGALIIRQDWLYRAGMFTILLSWVTAPLILLWSFMSSKILTTDSCVDSYTCATIVEGSSQTTLGMIVAGLIIGPLILYAFWACWCQIWSPESSG
jgi:hypothetical protein